jgi:glycosyltransferase involved in cell wall biosynthesis
MRIAQVAPLYERVPPKFYGGTERVVAFLTDALVQLGHEVTLFATADSRTLATLVPCAPEALRLSATWGGAYAYHLLQLERVFQKASQFDIIHFHTDALHFPLSRRAHVPCVTTLHGRLDLPELVPLYEEFDDQPVISISNAQRAPLPRAKWQGTVYHGLPPGLFTPGSGRGGYLTFLGRISPEKRVDRAIEIARGAGLPLKIAAKVDPADETYFNTQIKALLDQPGVEFLGEINEAGKAALLRDSLALLFPIDWPEPFGMVLIEALACGTPVVAFPRGSVPEILDHGVTGFVVDSVAAAVDAVCRVPTLSRDACRATFEKRFTAERMASDYIDAYQTLVERHPWKKTGQPRSNTSLVRRTSPDSVWRLAAHMMGADFT